MLLVYECFKSVQGESTHAGRICTFIRLSGCNLRCRYCDTAYAWEGGEELTVESLVAKVVEFNCKLVEITGGEPLLQKETPFLCQALLDKGYTVLVETNGSLDISYLPAGCIRIVDVKCPGSGHSDSFLYANIDHLRPADECKMVISNRSDFDWALGFVKRFKLYDRCTVLFSPNERSLEASLLAGWIIETDLPVRLNLQLHTYIWGANVQGV